MKSHSDARAIAAVFHGFRTIASHKEVTLEFRLPMEKSSEALAMLGSPGPDNWVALARLNLAATQDGLGVDASGEKAGTSSVPAANGPEGHKSTQDSAARDTVSQPPRAPRRWEEIPVAEQTGILRNDPVFWRFLEDVGYNNVNNKDAATRVIHELCHVTSCSLIGNNHSSRVLWKGLVDQYRAWQQEPSVVP